MTQILTDTVYPFPVEVPFVDDLGMQYLGGENGKAKLRLTVLPRLSNSWGVCHGGVIMAMLDVVMACAGRTLDPDARGGVTVEMKTSFLTPGRGTLTAYGTAFHRSTTMSFCEGEIRDESGTLVAKSLGTFKYIKKLGEAEQKRRSGTDG
jgi:uncharacterized protein (TIGR00369 family)